MDGYTHVLLPWYLNDPLSKLGIGSLTTHMNSTRQGKFFAFWREIPLNIYKFLKYQTRVSRLQAINNKSVGHGETSSSKKLS
jgi:hypothetical protein